MATEQYDSPPPAAPWPLWLPSTGSLALGCLPVVLISGGLLSVHYDAAAPLATVEAIQEVVPMGFAVRGLHYFGGHLLFLLLLAHTAARLWNRDYRRCPPAAWIAAILLLPVTLWVMFSGFLLRGDPEAAAALEVTGYLLGLLPEGGHAHVCLLGTTPDGLYAQHAATATFLFLVLLAAHSRVGWPGRTAMALTTTAALLLTAVASAPIAPQATTPTDAPWYLLGLQKSLELTPHPLLPFLPPLLLLVPLLFLPRFTDRWLRPALAITILPYVVLSLAAWLR